MHIRIADFVFHGGDLPSPAGFTVASIAGWTGGPGVKRDNVARRGAPGAFNIKGHSADRVVTFRGRYHGPSLDDVQYMNDAVSGLESLEQRVTVQWPETRWVDAHVDRVRFDPAGAFPWADYQIELWIPDSYKYGETRTSVNSGGSFTQSFHRGNAPAHPRFTVSGNMTSGYSLVGKGGRVFSVPQSLPAGQTATVDFRTGVVRHDGVRVASVTPSSWTVNGGEQVGWQLVPVTGSGTATCYLTDTFL